MVVVSLWQVVKSINGINGIKKAMPCNFLLISFISNSYRIIEGALQIANDTPHLNNPGRIKYK